MGRPTGQAPYGTYSLTAPTEVRAGGPTTASRARLRASSVVAAPPSADEDHKGRRHQHLQRQGHEPKMKQGTADQSAQERTAYSAQKRPPKTDRVGPGTRRRPSAPMTRPPTNTPIRKLTTGTPQSSQGGGLSGQQRARCGCAEGRLALGPRRECRALVMRCTSWQPLWAWKSPGSIREDPDPPLKSSAFSVEPSGAAALPHRARTQRVPPVLFKPICDYSMA